MREEHQRRKRPPRAAGGVIVEPSQLLAVMPPHCVLAIAVLVQAVRDYKAAGSLDDEHAADVVEFWKSAWFEQLCDMLDFTPTCWKRNDTNAN